MSDIERLRAAVTRARVERDRVKTGTTRLKSSLAPSNLVSLASGRAVTAAESTADSAVRTVKERPAVAALGGAMILAYLLRDPIAKRFGDVIQDERPRWRQWIADTFNTAMESLTEKGK